MICFFLIKHDIATCFWPLRMCACLCSPLLLLIQVPLSCCTKLILWVCFRTMIFLRDLAVGCVCISFPQQPLCCSCPFMKLLPTSLLSLFLVLLSSVELLSQYWLFWHSVCVTWRLQAQPPHLGSDTTHQSRGAWRVGITKRSLKPSVNVKAAIFECEN